MYTIRDRAESAQDAIRHAVAGLAGAETETSFVQTFAYGLEPVMGYCSTRCLPAGIESSLGREILASCFGRGWRDGAGRRRRRCAVRRRVAEGCGRAARSRPRQSSLSCAAATSMFRCWWCLARAVAMVNNMGATVIPGAGTVYRAMANKTAWGFFDAKGGALIPPTASRYRCRRRLRRCDDAEG